MNDSVAPAKQQRTSNPSSTSSRREDLHGTEQQPPITSNDVTNTKVDTSNDMPKLDWSKFRASFNIRHFEPPTHRPKPTKKRKRVPAVEPWFAENPFDAKLNTLYTVEPTKWWEDTRRYRKFTIAQETFHMGDCVFVKPDESQMVDGAPLPNWVAKVVEVRAASEAHVFLRIFWMYRPEDIPGGRRPYHGQNEVIASNTMQVIDALTVNGRADVRHWTEDDKGEVLDADQIFWRQTFNSPDGAPPGLLSETRKHCIDQAPFNPDSLLIHCEACDMWLHGQCLEQEAIKQAHKENGLPEPILIPDSQKVVTQAQDSPNGHRPKNRKSGKKVKSEIRKVNPIFTAEIQTGGKMKSRILLKDTREGHDGHETEKELHCLKCKALIE